MSQGPIDEPALSPGEREVERALAGLLPAAAGISREEMLYEAGRASAGGAAGRGHVWPWQAACLVLAGAALWGVVRPAGLVEKTVVIERPASSGAAVAQVPGRGGGEASSAAVPEAGVAMYASFPAGSYLQMRNAVLTHGVSAVKVEQGGGGAAEGSGEGNKSAWQLRQSMGGAW